MYDLERFGRLLKRDLLPLVHAQGFTACAGVFRRVSGERIDIVSLQGSRSGRRCCVNLGVHYSFLPASGRAGGAEADTSKLRQYDCIFRERLHDAGESDHWWTYGSDGAAAEASVASLVDLYGRRAHLFFERFEPFPEVFEELTPARLETGGFALLPVSPTPAHAALTMARLMEHIGRPDRCREFAEAGLQCLGSATRLRPELERLMDIGQTPRGSTF